jgi:murein DD-endopeptidase MepM/ murein hydrolase activator NlpD
MIIRAAFIWLFLCTTSTEVLAIELASPDATGTFYRITIKDRGKIIKEHVSSLQVNGGELIFRSNAKPDYRFIPAQNSTPITGLGIGAYRAFISDRPFFYSNTLVQVSADGEHFVIESPNSISIEITKIRALEPPVVTTWQPPFHSELQSKYRTLASRVVSHFGAGRTSFRVRHLHTGTDLAGAPSEPVYPIGAGIVEFVSYWDFEGTVLVRHRLASGESIMSKYIHVREPKVRAGEVVTQDTVLARLFTNAEFKQSKFKQNHLHLEVRKDYSDHGHASTHSQNTNDLSKCCINPLTFLSR